MACDRFRIDPMGRLSDVRTLAENSCKDAHLRRATSRRTAFARSIEVVVHVLVHGVVQYGTAMLCIGAEESVRRRQQRASLLASSSAGQTCYRPVRMALEAKSRATLTRQDVVAARR
jgi:hypothetical protein